MVYQHRESPGEYFRIIYTCSSRRNMSIDYTKHKQMSTLMPCFLTLAGFFTHKVLFLREIMNEEDSRILIRWMLDLMIQPVDDQSKAHRIMDAIRYLTSTIEKDDRV